MAVQGVGGKDMVNNTALSDRTTGDNIHLQTDWQPPSMATQGTRYMVFGVRESDKYIPG
jgi:hypothetical protein